MKKACCLSNHPNVRVRVLFTSLEMVFEFQEHFLIPSQILFNSIALTERRDINEKQTFHWLRNIYYATSGLAFDWLKRRRCKLKQEVSDFSDFFSGVLLFLNLGVIHYLK